MAKTTSPKISKPKGVRIRRGRIYIEYPHPQKEGKAKEWPLDYPCTPSNIELAGQIRANVIELIKDGKFNEEQFFRVPEKKVQSEEQLSDNSKKLFSYHAQRWLSLPTHDWSQNTRTKYKGILNNQWMPYLHDITATEIDEDMILDTLIP